MTIPSDIIVCIVTALGTGIMGLLTLLAHQLLRINSTLTAIDKRNTLEDERHANLAKDVSDIQARLDRKGILA